ncbi:MAG TPA: 23S rRNA (guanosine(2251)-2'-O)-methyltransferase RlmB [Ruminiclostridium sp.]|uniref:TrmH family tRNA/rRNA methyltransferase n=1 Tax=Acetivibrio saccincola TaxID=1677857 RepID=A0A2K9E6V9_9FIRM|nr:23S rRNA (guanosine(2251)-2'-O)-methyltransferase RlmB [Acetivibrio saccincola]AUG57226.1 Putative TrmH family tRNA/rRNA methyltransferase [Acetivibrio saccincola]NLW26816.1 23S rRNA (guanosine(2251)-2'-O)-methyltransferase RlmB [Acetivibrio saccincola]HAA43617.1 23S rRNA (guanosine(2251)-2'-O)-methyltransferase RlmB [Ruminiclostridium sp.]
MKYISSNKNAFIKEVKSLKNRKYREAKNMYFIEGIRFVQEALKENIKPYKIFISEKLEGVKGGKEILKTINEKKLDYFVLPHKLFKEISDTDNPQGILAQIEMKKYSLEEMVNENNFLVVLDAIQDPGNMGTIIRTADAAGATGVVLSEGCVDVYNPKVLRSTMGSVFHVPIYNSKDILKDLKYFKEKKIMICASHLEGETAYFNLENVDNVAIVIGNEARGIRDDIKDISDVLVKIPMKGRAESLNASIAAGLLIFEIMRKRI